MQKPWEDFSYNTTSEEIVNYLRKHTQNTRSDTYFRGLVTYYLAQMAASMRTYIVTQDRGKIPVNAYVCLLGESGMGKGHSINLMEEGVVNQFSERFTKETFPTTAEQSIHDEAQANSIKNVSDFEEEKTKLEKDFNSLGAMPYSFSEGTGPAYKQIRTKAQIAKIGSLNYMMDELGSNLLAAQELFTVCLETYDVGKVKDKITKSSNDNVRKEQRTEPVPSNMLIFGTPAKVFNGAKEEQEFISLQETGYARRFTFGVGNKGTELQHTAEELYDLLSSNMASGGISGISDRFGKLADIAYANVDIRMDRQQGIQLLQYKLDCEAMADTLAEHEHIRKAELQHRYFKALKIAGAYAFIECTPNITTEQLYAAIKVVEDSGLAFEEIMARPKPYERLAKYISEVGGEVTHADLVAALPFYRGSNSVKSDMLQLAQAWGYRNNIMIKRYMNSNIEFIQGESLKETDLNKLILSYSGGLAKGYKAQPAPFNEISKLTQTNGLHWCNHAFTDEHRLEVNAIPEFNMIVLDVDEGITLALAKELLEDYAAYFYTTKRHTQTDHRFRVILPMKYHLRLDDKDYKEFMSNIFSWLPFKVDEGTNQRSKKWLSNKGIEEYNEGVLFDPLQFIPKSSKNEEYQQEVKQLGDFSSTERWFANQMLAGNRNNTLLKFGMLLKDTGLGFAEVEAKLIDFNSKVADPICSDRLQNTVLKSIAKKYGG